MRTAQTYTRRTHRDQKTHNLIGKHCIVVDRFHDAPNTRRLRVKHRVPDIIPGDILIFCPSRDLRNLGHYIVLNQQVLDGGLHLAELGAWTPDITIAGQTYTVPIDVQYPPERVHLINIRTIGS